MARTGVNENKQANQQLEGQQTKAYDTAQESIGAGKAALGKLLSGQDIAPNPFLRPGYLSNVNRLQANSLDASQEAANAEMEAVNKRTGGLNSNNLNASIRDFALRKMRLADQLSSERAANDYRANLEYQQQQLQNIFTPAELEQGYYGTATGGRSSALGDLTQLGIAAYGPWMAGISAAGSAAGGALQNPKLT
jgi:hypothetical protein